MNVTKIADKDAFLADLKRKGGKVADQVTIRQEPIFDESGSYELADITEYHIVDENGYGGLLSHFVGEDWEDCEFTEFSYEDCDY